MVPLLCGGFTNAVTSKCYLLAKIGTWFGSPPLLGMNEARMYMAAVETNEGWLVTGEEDRGQS